VNREPRDSAHRFTVHAKRFTPSPNISLAAPSPVRLPSRVMPAIRFRNVTKTYHIQTRATPRLGAWLVNKLFEHFRSVPFDALHDVSFDVPKGQFIGLIGTNGAGKSTVLKLVSGISQPTSGSVSVSGRIASLLELGVGFHPDLSGMENIFYNGVVLGMTRAQVLERLGAIIEFSGVREFLHEPVRHYSSGMYARLATSVALHLDPEIILLDEVLAVADADFNMRALQRLLELHRRGTTIVLVTHDVTVAQGLCDRVVWLEHGRVVADGPAREVVGQYGVRVRRQTLPPGHPLVAPVDARPSPRIADVHLLDGEGRRIDFPETGKAVDIVVDVDDAAATAPYRVWVGLRWPDGRRLFEDASLPIAPGAGRATYRIDNWRFLRGLQGLDVALLVGDGADARVVDRRERALFFKTHTDPVMPIDEGLYAPEAEWEVRRVGD